MLGDQRARGLRVGDVERAAVGADLARDLARAPSTLMSPITTSAPSAASRRSDRGADPAGAAGDQRPCAPRASSRREHMRCAARLPHAWAAKRSRSSAAPARSATGSRCAGRGPAIAVVIGSRSEERAAEAARKLSELAPDAEIEGLPNELAAQAGPGRLPHRPVPRPVGEPQQPARGARAGPAAGRLHRAAGRRGERQGDPLARRLAGIGRPAGAGDGARGGHRGRGAAHGQRPDARRPRAPSSTRTCCSAATARPTRRGSRG